MRDIPLDQGSDGGVKRRKRRESNKMNPNTHRSPNKLPNLSEDHGISRGGVDLEDDGEVSQSVFQEQEEEKKESGGF
jgi:hypothetical protein